MIRIAIIVGSTRPGREGPSVAEWVRAHAARREEVDVEVVDLADHDLPHLSEPVAAAMSDDYARPATRAWSKLIAGFDGFVFVTPEYNHSFPGALKDALDHLYVEWQDKAAGVVGYGIDGGVRAVEQFRLVLTELRIANVRDQVALSLFDDTDDEGRLAPRPHQLARLEAMLDGVVTWAAALAPVRSTSAPVGPRALQRPTIGLKGRPDRDAHEGVTAIVAELQEGIDRHDADAYNHHFSDDVLWGSPYGATVHGYDELHEIHRSLHARGAGGESRYEIVRVMAPAPGLAVTHVRRTRADTSTPAEDGGFSEMALYVLVRRNGAWWLAAGQNTPIA